MHGMGHDQALPRLPPQLRWASPPRQILVCALLMQAALSGLHPLSPAGAAAPVCDVRGDFWALPFGTEGP